VGRLPTDPHPTAEVTRARRVLAEAEGALSLIESPPRRHLARSLGPALGLATERPAQIKAIWLCK